MQGVVGGVEVEDDLTRRSRMRLKEEVDQQAVDGAAVMADFVVARGSNRRVLEPVERALAGKRGTAPAFGLELTNERREHGIVAQLIVIDQILVAERDPEHPLRHHGLDGVLDQLGGPAITKAGGEPGHQANRPIGRAEQQCSGVRRNRAAIKPGHHLPPRDGCKTKPVTATLCRHRGAPLHRDKALSQKNYRRFRAPMHLPAVRNAGY